MDKLTYHSSYNNDSKITINATKITSDESSAVIYEFVLDMNLDLVACGYYQSVSQGRMKLINNFRDHLEGELFELNHVRVNPNINNDLVLHRLKKALQASGIEVKSPPEEILMAICYKPLGELNDTVRFYLNDENFLVFLSTTAKLSLV